MCAWTLWGMRGSAHNTWIHAVFQSHSLTLAVSAPPPPARITRFFISIILPTLFIAPSVCTSLFAPRCFSNRPQNNNGAANAAGPSELALASKLEELREARSLSSEIVDSGSKLYSLLSLEEETKRARENAMQFLDTISKNLENDDPQLHIERSIRMHIQEVCVKYTKSPLGF